MKALNIADTYLTGLNMEQVHVKIAQLYNTVVYQQTEDQFKLYSGGWKTVSTKKAINKCLPKGFYLFQKNFEWFLSCPNDVTLPFVEGIEVNFKKAV